MAAMQRFSELRQMGFEMGQAALDLGPLLVDIGLVHDFGRAGAPLIDDGDQAVGNAVAQRFH
ncbi:hypothetical protein D3C87_1851180 [compost metagenome]